MLPTGTLEKSRVESLVLNAPTVAVPAKRGIVSPPLESSVTRERAPVAADAPDLGVKVTLKAALWPAAKVIGRLNPLTAKPDPETLARATVTLELPWLLSTADKVWTLPVCTLPKLRLEGLAMRAPDTIATPETGTLTTGFGALLVTETLPLEVPDDCGVKVTEKVFFCPGDKVRGKVRPLILKPRPVTVACFTVTRVPPELTNVTA